MTFRQWLSHFRQWAYSILQFPLPKNDNHMWTGIVGERSQICLVCGAEGEDRDITDEELERDRAMGEEYEALHKKYFEESEDV